MVVNNWNIQYTYTTVDKQLTIDYSNLSALSIHFYIKYWNIVNMEF